MAMNIYLFEDISAESVGTVVKAIYGSEDEDDILYVNSDGGDVTQALALYDVMRQSDIPTICLGSVMSCATVIAASGSYRYAMPNTTFMIHSVTFGGGDAASPAYAQAHLDDALRLQDRMASLLAFHSKKGKAFWKRKMSDRHDVFFDARKALEWGLIDEILTP